MIEKFSIGIDIVDINRFKKLDYKKTLNFIKKSLQNQRLIIA